MSTASEACLSTLYALLSELGQAEAAVHTEGERDAVVVLTSMLHRIGASMQVGTALAVASACDVAAVAMRQVPAAAAFEAVATLLRALRRCIEGCMHETSVTARRAAFRVVS